MVSTTETKVEIWVEIRARDKKVTVRGIPFFCA